MTTCIVINIIFDSFHKVQFWFYHISNDVSVMSQPFRLTAACMICPSSSVVKVSQSCPTLRHHGLYSPWNSPGQNTGVGSLSLLQGIFPTQGSNPGLPHCRWILYQLSHKGSPHQKYAVSNGRHKKAKVTCIYLSIISGDISYPFQFLKVKW